MKKSHSKLNSQRVKKKLQKLQMNEYEISIHVRTIHRFELCCLSLQIENIKQN